MMLISTANGMVTLQATRTGSGGGSGTGTIENNSVLVPFSDQREHFHSALYFLFGPCTGPQIDPVQCD